MIRGKLIVAAVIVLAAIVLSGCTAFDREELGQLKEIEAGLHKTAAQTVAAQEKPAEKFAAIDPQSFENLSAKVKAAVLKTNYGDIAIEFYAIDAPQTVNNFLNLVQRDFYDGVKFHRVIKDFMIQTGDPNSKNDNPADDGKGGPGYKFADEINSRKLVRGSVAMANSGPNTNGSQFFIVTKESTPWLDGKHTNFGQVVEGIDVVMTIESAPTDDNDCPLVPIIINNVELIMG